MGEFEPVSFYQVGEGVLPDFYEHDWWLAGSRWDAYITSLTPSSNVILGYYKDRIINGATAILNYTITIYLKYKLKSTKPCVPN